MEHESLEHETTAGASAGVLIAYDLKVQFTDNEPHSNAAAKAQLNERVRQLCDRMGEPYLSRCLDSIVGATRVFALNDIRNVANGLRQLLRVGEELGLQLKVAAVRIEPEHKMHLLEIDEREFLQCDSYKHAKAILNSSKQEVVPGHFHPSDASPGHVVYCDGGTAEVINNSSTAEALFRCVFLTTIVAETPGEDQPEKLDIWECFWIASRASSLPARLLVMLSGSGSTLQNLIDRQGTAKLPATVVRVISDNAKAFGLERAKSAGIPTLVLSPRCFEARRDYKHELWNCWTKAQIDFVILAGYLKKVPVASAWVGRVINIHPALLPTFGGQGMYGIHVHQVVLKSGERTTGCTVHFVDEEYDRGPIIEQAFVQISACDTELSIQTKVQAAERELYPKVIADLVTGRVGLKEGRVVRLS